MAVGADMVSMLNGSHAAIGPGFFDARVKEIDRAIIDRLSKGETPKGIARSMDIAYRTLEHRLERLRKIFGARTTIHLVTLFVLKTQWVNGDTQNKRSAMLQAIGADSV